MKVSAKTEYACMAMLELAARYGSSEPVRIRTIADEHGIPSRFLVQILLQLKGAGFVASTRGASGGYQLVKKPEDISLGEVMAVIEGPESEPTGTAARSLPPPGCCWTPGARSRRWSTTRCGQSPSATWWRGSSGRTRICSISSGASNKRRLLFDHRVPLALPVRKKPWWFALAEPNIVRENFLVPACAWHGICALSEAWRGVARSVTLRFGRRRWSAASMCVCLSGNCGNCEATVRMATDGCFWMTCSSLTCWRFSIPPFGLCEPSRTSARRCRRSGISRCRRSAAARCRTLIVWSSRSRLEPILAALRSRLSRQQASQPGRRDEDLSALLDAHGGRRRHFFGGNCGHCLGFIGQ